MKTENDDLAPLKCLIVEDEGLLALQLESVVEDAGHHVVGWATSSKEACQLLDQTEADIVFLDLHLADGVTGIAVAEHLSGTENPHVVFMTANPTQIPRDGAGAVGIIAKPHTLDGLSAALRYLHEGVRKPPPRGRRPAGLKLSPPYETRWTRM